MEGVNLYRVNVITYNIVGIHLSRIKKNQGDKDNLKEYTLSTVRHRIVPIEFGYIMDYV